MFNLRPIDLRRRTINARTMTRAAGLSYSLFPIPCFPSPPPYLLCSCVAVNFLATYRQVKATTPVSGQEFPSCLSFSRFRR